jgi:hypothetical protein
MSYGYVVLGHTYDKEKQQCECGWRSDPRSHLHRETQWRAHLDDVYRDEGRKQLRYVATGGEIWDNERQKFLTTTEVEERLNEYDSSS